jgi:hypothetical protein
MGGTRPLTIYDFVKVVWRADIRGFQSCSFGNTAFSLNGSAPIPDDSAVASKPAT